MNFMQQVGGGNLSLASSARSASRLSAGERSAMEPKGGPSMREDKDGLAFLTKPESEEKKKDVRKVS